MELVSLDELRAKEHNLFDNTENETTGFATATRVDRYMELNNERMGEDSEGVALRENRASRMLRQGSFPSYQPH